MDPAQFLILNGLVVIALAVFFFMGRSKKHNPTSLNLRKTQFTPVKEMDINDEEELNVYFNFNGHMWDAYEIIGVPAGSPLSDVEMAYIKSRNRIDEESKEILEMAYAAIHERVDKKKNS